MLACTKVVNAVKGTADEKTSRRRVLLLSGACQDGPLTGENRILEGLMHAGLTDTQRRAVVTELAAPMQNQRRSDPPVFDLIAP